ncbi:hypothetical protein FRB99_007113 [Tulasnella sp. 403]|nr:hypothetical protein FRB99_007113 [Tulasnella sp. 403]
MAARTLILKAALPFVPSYGFTRRCLTDAAESLPTQISLSETAFAALFGQGEEAKRTLIQAWLDEGIERLKFSASQTDEMAPPSGAVVHAELKTLLTARLRYNEPVLQHLADAFATLAAGGPLLDLRPAVKHAGRIADEALHIAGDRSVGGRWYARRGAVALVYGAAELHQLTSPDTAVGFLARLLDETKEMERMADEVGEFGGFVEDGWTGIVRSRGVFP